MIKRIKDSERRQYPRLYRQLPLNVAVNGYDFVTSTQNVSCVGTYCHIDKYVPEFTKVMVKLSLPLSSKEEVKTSDVECKGVIVRTEDVSTGGFNIAILFNGINDSERRKISKYVSQFLPSKSTES
jgi:hypothetical protein